MVRGDFLAAIQAGLTIIHINTELRVAYKILPGAENAMEGVLSQRLASFQSNGRS